MRKHFILVLVLTAAAMIAYAQTDEQKQAEEAELKKNYLYQWTDDRGGLHITDGLGKVPAQYRKKAVKLEQPKNEDSEQGQQEQGQFQPESSQAPGGGVADEAAKAAWQQRLKETKQLLVNAEKRYRELDRERAELLGVRGAASQAPIANRVRAEDIASEMKTVQKEIYDTRHMLEVVIPEEARKAGVPPGWLRE